MTRRLFLNVFVLLIFFCITIVYFYYKQLYGKVQNEQVIPNLNSSKLENRDPNYTTNDSVKINDTGLPVFLVAEPAPTSEFLKIYTSDSNFYEAYNWTGEGADSPWCFLTINSFNPKENSIVFQVDSNVRGLCPNKKFLYKKGEETKELSNDEFLKLINKVPGYKFVLDPKTHDFNVLKEGKIVLTIKKADDRLIKISDDKILGYSNLDKKIKLLNLTDLTSNDYMDFEMIESFSYNPDTDLLIINDDKFKMTIIKFSSKEIIKTYPLMAGKWIDDERFFAIKFGFMPDQIPKDYIHDAYYIKNYKSDAEKFFSKGQSELFTYFDSINSVVPKLSVPD